MFKKLILILSVVTATFSQLTAQNPQISHQITQSCSVTTDGKILIHTGGHYTTALSEQLQLCDSLHSSTYDTVSSTFKNTKHFLYSYDMGGLLIESSSKTIDKSGTSWSNSQQTGYKYSGYLLFEETYKSWDKTLQDWADFMKYKYSYESDNSLLTIFNLPWDADSSEFKYSTKDMISYDANSRVSAVTNQKFNKNLGSWDNYLRINFTYSGGYVSEKLYQVFNKTSMLWDDYQKETITYNGSNKTEVVMQVKSATTNWENYSKNVFAYDNAAMSSMTEYLWYGSWMDSRKILYTCNSDKLVTLALTLQWAAHLNSYRDISQEESYYSQHQVFGISETPANSIIVNNPVSKHAAFQLSGLNENTQYLMKLISVNGTLLMSLPVISGQSIQLNSQIPNGIYILNLSAPGLKTWNQKILLTD